MHKSTANLKRQLINAEKKVRVGGRYYHYKNPDRQYKVIKLAITEWDDQVCVIYEAQYGDKITFVRPLASWHSRVEYEGNNQDRFTLI